jgi:hypothetical protein
MLDLRETIRVTLVTINKSQALILESDRLIARWQTLDDRWSHEKPQDHDPPHA